MAEQNCGNDNITTEHPTIEDKKKYLSTITNSKIIDKYFTKDDLKEIGNKIIHRGSEHLLKELKTGISINLDLITNDALIIELYCFVYKKVNKK